MRFLGTMLLILTLACPDAEAQMNLGDDTTLAFATVEQGRRILTTRDDFVERMSPFDRAARMKTSATVSEEDYLEFVGRNVLAWDDAEKEKIASVVQGVQSELEALALPLPAEVFVVKTTGNEEGGAAYTRANAIVFPERDLEAPAEQLQNKFCHELFHVLSRANPDLRENLYAAIGFAKCEELAFPKALASRKITNPDAPRNDHCIRLQVDGQQRWAIPILYSSAETYDEARGGAFFRYLEFRMLLGELDEGSSTFNPTYDGDEPKLVDLRETTGFFEQVGRNTRYIIHPEEILADNFALLAMGQGNLPSPEIVRKLRAILKDESPARPRAPADTATQRR